MERLSKKHSELCQYQLPVKYDADQIEPRMSMHFISCQNSSGNPGTPQYALAMPFRAGRHGLR